MKYIDSCTYPEHRASFVTMEHRGKFYTGDAWCHPDDEWSEYTGCGFAELRAMLKAYKAEYKEKKEELRPIENFVKAVQQYKKFNPEEGSAKAIFRQYNRKMKELEKIKQDIEIINSHIKARIKAFEKLEKKAKEDNQN